MFAPKNEANPGNSPKVNSSSTPDELSIIDNYMPTRKKQQARKSTTPTTPKSLPMKQKKFLENIYFRMTCFCRSNLS